MTGRFVHVHKEGPFFLCHKYVAAVCIDHTVIAQFDWGLAKCNLIGYCSKLQAIRVQFAGAECCVVDPKPFPTDRAMNCMRTIALRLFFILR